MVPSSVSMSEDFQHNSFGQSSGGVLRWVILRVGLIVGLCFGIQALRNAKPPGAEPYAAGGHSCAEWLGIGMFDLNFRQGCDSNIDRS